MKRTLAQIKNLKRQRVLKDSLFILAGIGSASIGLKGFLLPNNFLDGGATGVSLLLEMITKIDVSILLILVNIPFIFIGYKQFSKEFAVKSSLAILGLALLVHFISFWTITADKLLIAVFGGFFLGAGVGSAIRGGAVIDGTEVLAVAVSRKSTLTVGDFIINGIEEYIGVTIVSLQHEAIQVEITHTLGRGITVYQSESGYGKQGSVDNTNRKVLFCVVTRLEVSKLLLEIEKIDPEAFVVQHPIKDTKGGMIKRRPLH